MRPLDGNDALLVLGPKGFGPLGSGTFLGTVEGSTLAGFSAVLGDLFEVGLGLGLGLGRALLVDLSLLVDFELLVVDLRGTFRSVGLAGIRGNHRENDEEVVWLFEVGRWYCRSFELQIVDDGRKETRWRRSASLYRVNISTKTVSLNCH
jgi:hypothetical protein